MTVTNATLMAIRRILRATDLHGRDVAAAVGLTAVQLRVLQIVQDAETITAKGIAERLQVSQATITTLLDKLVWKGMVERQVSPFDRRQKQITVTQKGVAAISDAPDPLQHTFVRRFERLERWEQAMLLASLERVSLLLDAEDIDASPVLMSGDINGKGVVSAGGDVSDGGRAGK